MDESNKAKFIEYARLKTEEAAIKARVAEISGELLGVMLEIDGQDTKIETSIGSFSIKKTKAWTYPMGITQAEENLKTAKKQAQQVGDATSEVSNSLYFRRKTA